MSGNSRFRRDLYRYVRVHTRETLFIDTGDVLSGRSILDQQCVKMRLA